MLDETLTPGTDQPDPVTNLAQALPSSKLHEVGEAVRRGYDIDESSMEEWRKQSTDAMALVRMETKPKDWPFENAANVAMPTITAAVIQFAARAYPAIISDNQPVKVRTLGPQPSEPETQPEPVQQPQMPPQAGQEPLPPGLPPELAGGQIPPGAPQMPQMPPPPPTPPHSGDLKQARAERVAKYLSYQLMEEQEEWEGDTDKLLHILATVGVGWRKQYFCPSEQRIVSELVHPDRVTVNNGPFGFNRVPRITETLYFYPWEITERQKDGRFLDVDLSYEPTEDENGEMQDRSDDDLAPQKFWEQHTRHDLDGDGYAEPYMS